jgi:branched-chain amino acid transport system permease protein
VLTFGGIRIAQTQVVTVAVALLAMVALAWFFRTKTGIAMRATAFDQEAAMAQGISVGKVFAVAWAIGAALAAIGGIFSSVFPRGAAGVTPFTALIVFRAFPAVVIGGLDSITGAIVGGMIVGLAEVFTASYLGSIGWLGTGFAGIVPWLLMMAVLLVKPYGLFGTEEIRRV